MSEQLKELQARLTGASYTDYPGCLALFEETAALSREVKRATREYMPAMELVRRAERMFGLAVQHAQRTGLIRIKGNSHPNGELLDVPHPGPLHEIRKLIDHTDEDFEQALKNARERGSLGRSVVIEELQILRPPAPLPPPPVPERKGTARGRRTLEHMAIQMNAIALGVGDISPDEVPGDMQQIITGVFHDIGTIRSFLRKVNYVQ